MGLIFAVPVFTLRGKTDDKRSRTIETMEKYFQFTASRVMKVKLSIKTRSFKLKGFRET